MAPWVICMSRGPLRIQPNICVERGTHDVPEPSWLMGSPRSVVDDMFITSIDEPLIFILSRIGDGDIDLFIFIPAPIGAGGIGAAPCPLLGAVAEELGAAVMFGIGPGCIVMPGIGAIVACGAGCAARAADGNSKSVVKITKQAYRRP